MLPLLLDNVRCVGYNDIVVIEAIHARGETGGLVASQMFKDEAGRQIV
jgi:hypothetical protein